jgi:phosphatidylserine/phosphatidylglycerophosphate/cardiolipin synthase-like enzyme
MNRTLLVLALVLFLVTSSAEARRSKKRAPHPLEALEATIDEALVKAPVPDEVCFTPGDPCDVKLYKFVQSAQKSLDVAIFDLNLDKLVHEILVKSKKVPVRVLVDRRQAKSDHSLVPLLHKAGVQVRFGAQRGIMHNKFIIVDSRMIETGSFNFTNGAAFKNNENQVYLGTPSLVDRFQKRFNLLWEEAKPYRP